MAWNSSLRKTIIIIVTLIIIFIVSAFIYLRIMQANNYNEYKKLSEQVRVVFTGMVNDIYDRKNANLLRPQRLAQLKSNMLPKLQQLKSIAYKMDSLPLSSTLKPIAITQSKIVMKEYLIYSMIYKELLDTATKKYRPAISAATDSINRLRKELGQAQLNAGVEVE